MHVASFPTARRLARVRLDRNPHGKGWMLRVQLGPGAGYRWIDFGNYSQNIAAPWYRHLSLTGRTARLGWNVKADNVHRRIGGHFFTRNANVPLFPGWW